MKEVKDAEGKERILKYKNKGEYRRHCSTLSFIILTVEKGSDILRNIALSS